MKADRKNEMMIALLDRCSEMPRWDNSIKKNVSECNFGDIDRARIKNVILELTVDEFELICAAMANMSYDVSAGPAVLMEHPHAMHKMMVVLRVLEKCELANKLALKLENMTNKLCNTENI